MKLVRRNRLAFAVGAVAFFTVSAGFGSSTWLFLRESHARHEQARLRSEAEAARAVETRLRGHAEAREACAQAAVKLSYGQIEQADQLLAAIPTDRAPSSLEAADVYRKVGEWHRSAGRIQQAAERFTALAGSISAVDRSDLYKISGVFYLVRDTFKIFGQLIAHKKPGGFKLGVYDGLYQRFFLVVGVMLDG
jgi:hypothetical protein